MTIKLELCIKLYLNQKKEIKNLKLFMKKKYIIIIYHRIATWSQKSVKKKVEVMYIV